MEKRKEKRFREENEVFIKSATNGKDSSNSVEVNAHTFDISLGGARVCSEKFFDIGTIIRMEIELKRTGQSVRVDGEIKWFRDNEDEDVFEFGVEFLHSISHTLLSLIKHLYAEREGIPTAVL